MTTGQSQCDERTARFISGTVILRLQRTVPTYRRTWHRTTYSSGNVDTWTMLTLILGFSLNLSHCNPIRNTVMYSSGPKSEKDTVLCLQVGVGGRLERVDNTELRPRPRIDVRQNTACGRVGH
jgi:hypothetical protein